MKDSKYHYKTFPVCGVATDLSPDLILISKYDRRIILCELTCPMEANVDSWNKKKMQNYQVFRTLLKAFTVENFPFEVSARGIVAQSCYNMLEYLGFSKARRKAIGVELSKVALESSRRIFQAMKQPIWKNEAP